MIKHLGLAALALSLPFIPAALGCSSSSSSPSTGDDTGLDSGIDTGTHDTGTTTDSSTNHDGGETFDSSSDTSTTTDGGTGSMCPADTSGFTGTPFVAVTPQANVCSAAEIQAFITVCGDNYDETACGNWFSATDAGASDACGMCITGTSQTASNGAIYFDAAMENFGPNYGACIALNDTTNGTACGTAVNNVTDCVGVACDGCGDQTSFDSCDMTEYSSSGSCSSFGSTENTACANDTGDAGAIATCQPGGGTAQDPDWTYIINLICGTGQ